jgi:hypothetical protein
LVTTSGRNGSSFLVFKQNYEPTNMSLETTVLKPANHTNAWLREIADEFISIESAVPPLIAQVEDNSPQWVQNLEREVGAALFPVAKLKGEQKLTPWRLGAIIGHQCSLGVWMMESIEKELNSLHKLDKSKLKPEEIEAQKKLLVKLRDEFCPAVQNLARSALSSCVGQPYEDTRDFLLAYSAAFAKKPGSLGDIGHSSFSIQYTMLIYWPAVARMNSVHELHQALVKKFDSFFVGNLKRVEKICERIGLHFRKPGRPKQAT